MSQFSNFDEVVRDICNSADDPGAKNYVRIARHVKNVVKSLNNLVLPTGVTTKKFNIAANLTIPMPPDTISVHKVGDLVSSGRIRIYKNEEFLNDELLYGGCTCGSTIAAPDEPVTACSLCTFYNYTHNGHLGEVYGAYTTQATTMWKYDEMENRISLRGQAEVGEEVFVEYRSSTNELILIPTDAYKLIEARVLAAFFRSSRPGVSQNWERQESRELQYYKHVHSQWDWDQFRIALYGSAKAAKY